MKILLIHNRYRSGSPSGEDIVFDNESGMLEAAGHDVIRYVRSSDETDDYSLTEKLSLLIETVYSKRTYDEVSRLIGEHEPDVAHLHNTFPLISSSAIEACHDEGVPVVQTLHNYRLVCTNALLYRNGSICEDCVGGGVYRSIWRACYRDSRVMTAVVAAMTHINRAKSVYTRKVSRFIAPSSFLAGTIVRSGVDPAKVVVKPHFVPAPPEVSHEKSEYLVYVGRLSAEKGIETLISACRMSPDVPVKVLGDGALREQMEGIVNRENLRVEFLGFVGRGDVFRYVRSAKALIMPSSCHEVFGLSVIEAFAMGTPVIASDIGGLSDLIEDGVNGWRFGVDVAEELSDLMMKAIDIEDPVFYRGVRDYFDERFTEEENLRLLMSVYDGISRRR